MRAQIETTRSGPAVAISPEQRILYRDINDFIFSYLTAGVLTEEVTNRGQLLNSVEI